MPWWRNGRRGRLKICCQQWREGSSPSRGTRKKARFLPCFFVFHTFFWANKEKTFATCHTAPQTSSPHIYHIHNSIIHTFGTELSEWLISAWFYFLLLIEKMFVSLQRLSRLKKRIVARVAWGAATSQSFSFFLSCFTILYFAFLKMLCVSRRFAMFFLVVAIFSLTRCNA